MVGTLGFFLGGVADEKARDRTLNVQERQVGLGEEQMVEERRQGVLKSVRENMKRTREMFLKMKGDFRGTTAEFNEQLGGRLQAIAGELNQTAAAVGEPGLGPGFFLELDQTPTVTEASQTEAEGEVAATGIKIEAAGDDPQKQEALGVRIEPKSSTLFNPKTNNWVTLPDIRSPEGRGRYERLLRAGYVEAPLSVQAAKGEDIGLPGPSDSEAGKYRDAEVSAMTALDILGEMEESLGGDATLTGAAQSVFTALTGAVGSVQQLVRVSGGWAEKGGQRVNERDLLDAESYDFSVFEDESLNTGAFRSNVVALAYMLARASDPSGRVSDADVQNQIQRLGADSGNKDLIRGSIKAVRNQIKKYMKNRHEVLSRDTEGMPALSDRFSDKKPFPKVDKLMEKKEITQEDLDGLSQEEKQELANRLGVKL